MRKFLLLLLLVSGSLFSQVKPFNLDNVEWTVLSCGWNIAPPPSWYNFTHYKLCGDSIYQGQRYKRIYEGTAAWYPPQPGMTPSKPYPQPSVLSFYGLLRQDSITKRNYFLDPWGLDTLLMDYNLNVGDTIKGGFYLWDASSVPCVSGPLWIKATDSISLGGNKFRILYTDSIGQNYCGAYRAGYFMIEGLGHINGVFQSSNADEHYCYPFENCVGVDTIIFNCDCSNLSGINEMQGNKKVEIYPAPAGNTIRFNRPINGRITIYNSLGKKVLEIACDNCDEIDIACLPKGLYFLDLVEGNLSLRRKIIKS